VRPTGISWIACPVTLECAALIARVPGDESSVMAAAENPPSLSGLHALCLFPAMHGYFMHDPRVEVLLERAAVQGSLVFVHCGVLTVGVRKEDPAWDARTRLPGGTGTRGGSHGGNENVVTGP
jgi:hypothetical protein